MSFAHLYKYQWRAHFKDGSVLRQFDADGTQHRFAELEERANRQFGHPAPKRPDCEIDYLEVTGLPQPVVVAFPPGATPIVFTRVRRDRDTAGNEVECRWHYFGFEQFAPNDPCTALRTFLVVHEPSGLVSLEFTDETSRD